MQQDQSCEIANISAEDRTSMWDVLKCFRLVLDESYGLDLLRSSMDWTFYELMDLLQVAQQICPGTTTSNLVSSRKIAQ